MVMLRRVNEGLTQDNWKKIRAKLNTMAGKRGLKLDNISTNGFFICDKKDANKCVKFNMDLLNTAAGEIEVTSGGKKWDMGEAQVRDRKNGGTKKPDMDAQVANILDFVEAKLAKSERFVRLEADMNRPLWEGWSAMDYAKENEMIMDMIMSGRSNTYRTDRIPKTKAELKQAIKNNCTPNVPKLQNAVVTYFCQRYGIR